VRSLIPYIEGLSGGFLQWKVFGWRGSAIPSRIVFSVTGSNNAFLSYRRRWEGCVENWEPGFRVSLGAADDLPAGPISRKRHAFGM